MDGDQAEPEPGGYEDKAQRQDGADVAPQDAADGKVGKDEGEARDEDAEPGDGQRCVEEVDGVGDGHGRARVGGIERLAEGGVMGGDKRNECRVMPW